MSRSKGREMAAGVLVLLAAAGLGGLLAIAGTGTGFLTSQKTVDVIFRDGQGIRVGSPVRVAGIDAGRVTAIDLAEVDGSLRARIRLSIPTTLAAKLRQDVKVAVQTGLTGQSCVNIVSSGRSSVALVPGQLVQGVESSFFDPVLEQVGLGPVERSHISHVIGELRQTVDTAGPKLRHTLGSLQDAAAGLNETVDAAKPKVLATVGHVEEIAGTLNDAKMEETLTKLRSLTAQAEALMRENRAKVGTTLASVNELAVTVNETVKGEKPRIDAFVDNLNATRAKTDRVLANVESMTGTGAAIMAKNRGDIERVMGNVRDASDFGVKLVQKLLANPFYLSPFYKPTPEDLRAQGIYDAANVFMNGAKELHDATVSLQAMAANPKMTDADRQAYRALFQKALDVTGSLKLTQQKLSDGLNTPARR